MTTKTKANTLERKPRKQLAAMGLWCYPSPLDVMLVLMQIPTMLSYIFQLYHTLYLFDGKSFWKNNLILNPK